MSQDLPPQQVSLEVLREKYAKGDEHTVADVRRRVARALAAVEPDPAAWEPRFLAALEAGFVPAGRINSAAGTGLSATLINCFVQPIADSIAEPQNDRPGIYTALAEAAETMRRGGGVGYDFSAIRPRGALVRGTASRASGPVSYMRVFDRSCETVESAGARRGAQMGVMRCDHPDVGEFVHAKDRAGELTNFNISVAVTEKFLQAVVDDADFELVHAAEPAMALRATGARRREDGLWIYRTVRARALWEDITRSTYDHAEPGILFVDRINAENNLYYCETIEATNPCVTADTWVATAQGPRQVADLVGQPFVALVDGQPHPSGPEGFFATGTKPVLNLVTRGGRSVRLTANHLVRRVCTFDRHSQSTEWVEAGRLRPGDLVQLHAHRDFALWPGRYTAGEGYLLGLLVGDGTLKTDKAVLSVWDPGLRRQANGDVVPSLVATSVMDAVLEAAAGLRTRADFRGWQRMIEGRNEFRLASTALRDLAFELGLEPGRKGITDLMERASGDFCTGLLRGLFDADGSVQGHQGKGVSVRLSQSDLHCLQRVQRMLLRLGINSRLYANRRLAGRRRLPDGKGGSAWYAARAAHELIIAGANLVAFAERVGFAHADKRERLQELLGAYRRRLNRERFVDVVASIAAAGEAEVYDVQIPGVNAFDGNGLWLHNCGEQPLPAYGCCCLGSIDLTRFVVEAFGPAARFDHAGFEALVALSVRMLDDVLDATIWPLARQDAEARAKRRVGLGFTGLGDALAMLDLRYDSPQAVAFGGEVARRMRDAAYGASVDLARERGAFPLFDADKYLAGTFASRLPEDLRARIRAHGLRNSHLLSIAPTGTISLAFADNASNGIEPPFSWSYWRNKRTADGTVERIAVEDHAYRLWLAQGGDPERLPAAFVTALELPVAAHVAMLEAVQPYIDSAISKTVNIPVDYPFDDFRDLYLHAWRAGLKGLATFRPNDVTGSVLSIGAPAEPDRLAPQDFDLSDPDRRIRLDRVPDPALASLRWPGRPDLPDGNPSWTYMLEHPGGAKFALFVGHLDNPDGPYPFEVWVNGAEQPRGLGAVAKTLSMDMRVDDRAWLKSKLDAMMKLASDDAFDLRMPPRGEPRRVPGLVAGVATLVNYRLERLGTFRTPGRSPVLDALMSVKEPKTGADGTMSWTVDIANAATGDEFALGLKELVLPNGERRPYSIWLAGEYPRVLDGLCLLLSMDMRVIDPAWIGAKLRKLLDYPEPMGDFIAWVPGEHRQQVWPSTIAYMARLVIHRYAMLGILDEDGYPVSPMGVLDLPTNVTPLRRAVGAQEVMPGKRCRGCGAYAVVRKDGCDFCTACGELGACG